MHSLIVGFFGYFNQKFKFFNFQKAALESTKRSLAKHRSQSSAKKKNEFKLPNVKIVS